MTHVMSTRVAEEISATFKTYFPRTMEANKAKLLLLMVTYGNISGVDGGMVLDDEFIQVGNKK